jgi:hypothetical protein
MSLAVQPPELPIATRLELYEDLHWFQLRPAAPATYASSRGLSELPHLGPGAFAAE